MSSIDALLQSAREASLAGEHPRAIELCQLAQRADPANPTVAAFLGLTLWRAGAFREALAPLSEALSRFPGQEELSFALAESLNATAQPQQALDVLALVPASLAAAKDFVAVAARARAMLSGEAPSVEIEARLIEAHEKGYQEWLDENSRRVVELYPLWARGHAIYAAALCAVAGRRARPENFEVSSDWGVPQVHAHWRKQLAVSAARQRDEAACQVSEALKLDPADAVARHVATRVAFEVTGAVHEQDRPLLEAMAGGAVHGPYPLHSVMGDAACAHVRVDRLEPPQRIRIPEPQWRGGHFDFAKSVGEAIVNERYVAVATGAQVAACSDVTLVAENYALAPCLSHPLGELVSTVDDAWMVLGSARGVVLRQLPVMAVEGLAVNLLGTSARFYGHWLFDFLARLRSLAQHAEFSRSIFLVEADMPATHLEALELILGRPVTCVKVQRGAAVTVDRLLFSGADVFFPHALRPGSPTLPSLAPAHVPSLAYLRERAEVALGAPVQSRQRRLFIRRRSVLRRLVNEEALCEALTRDWGFEALWPETMSFEEQVRWFRDAEVVVGAQGSAMSNCVFCAPGTKIASICSGYAANFPAWAAALEAMGMRHCFLVGEGIENTHPIRLHWDLSLELRQIIEVLEELGVRRG